MGGKACRSSQQARVDKIEKEKRKTYQPGVGDHVGDGHVDAGRPKDRDNAVISNLA